jgi:hypothetical protein
MIKFNIPTQITQGDRTSWWEHFPEHNPLTDTLSCFIRGQATALDLTAVGSVDGFEFTLSETSSMQLLPGNYQAQFVIYPSSGRLTLGKTKLTVLTSFEDLTELDVRSDDEKELEQITIAIAKLASGAVSEYRIGDRLVRYQDLTVLTQRQQYLRNRIAKAKNPKSIGGRNVGVRFSND